MKKTFKVVMLPTEKPSKIGLLNDRLYLFNGKLEDKYPSGSYKNINLYIISDDEIKEGDWVLNKEINEIYQRKHYNNGKSKLSEQEKKIVATTDKSLDVTDHRVSPVPNFCDMPQLPESFTQAYIKAYNEGKPITEVDLEIEYFITVPQGNYSKEDYGYQIKTRPNNTVIIHQSKMYSRDEVLILVASYAIDNHQISKEDVKLNKWIQDNL